MKKKIKKIFYGCLSLVVMLAIWIMIGSIDSTSYDDRGLLDHAVKIPEEQNGYREIAYLHNENSGLQRDYKIREKLKDHLHHKEWDDDFVQQILDKHKRHIDSAILATKYKFLRFPALKDAGDIPLLSLETYLSRLIILKSMAAAKAGDFSEAIMLAESAVIFYLVGLVMQHDSLAWVYSLAVDYELNEMQYANIANIFHQLKSYKEDGFHQIFYREYAFFRNTMDALMEKSFAQRWDDYLFLRDFIGGESSYNSLVMFLHAIFPRYYVHKNRMLDQVAQLYTRLSNESEKYCDNLSLEDPGATQNAPSGFRYIIKPNSAFEFHAKFYDEFSSAYLKRCFSHAHIEGIKTIIALKRFQIKTGRLPDNLVELVPNYLKMLPIDPFNGDTLKYTKEKMWLYSVGNNFEDNGGSKESFYSEDCKEESLCSKNPTFLMHSQHR